MIYSYEHVVHDECLCSLLGVNTAFLLMQFTESLQAFVDVECPPLVGSKIPSSQLPSINTVGGLCKTFL